MHKSIKQVYLKLQQVQIILLRTCSMNTSQQQMTSNQVILGSSNILQASGRVKGPVKTTQKSKMSRKKKCIIILIVIVIIVTVAVTLAKVICWSGNCGVNDSQYTAYCPVYSTNGTDIYLAYIRMYQTTTAAGHSIKLSYCGWARPWQKTCSDASFVCSVPGPFFHMPNTKPALIIWINDVNTTGIQLPDQDCYAQQASNNFCTIDAKNAANGSCTFQDPTYLRYSHDRMTIGRSDYSVNPHIHGLPIRPTWDGHPLSWFSNSGKRGTGFQSFPDSAYYSKLQNSSSDAIDWLSTIPELKKYSNYKIIKIESKQPAGNYFYHDHAMRTTKFNVKHGLSSIFTIYDPTVEAMLPSSQYQIYILFSTTALNSGSNEAGHQQIMHVVNSTQELQRGPTYMYRFINGHFDNIYRNISFAVYYSNGSNGVKQLNPNSESLTDNMHLIPFDMVGADGSLFHQPITNVTQFDLAEAQRMQIFIRFDPSHGVPPQVTKVYLVCFDVNLDKLDIKLTFNLQNTNNGAIIDANQLLSKINTPYTNLALIPDSQIAVKRMKPLFSYPSDTLFSINGRYMFDMGASDRPQIGTTDLFYFINNLAEAHPIHVHLVNFQVSPKKYSLKLTPQGCTFYQLDYIRQTGYPPFTNMTDADLCSYLLQSISQEEAKQLFEYLSGYNLQNVTQIDSEIGNYSGFNVMQKIATPAQQTSYDAGSQQNCGLNSVYKYICDDISSTVPEHYKRWKDTALIQGYSVTILIVRWAKNDYDAAKQSYPYFTIPQQQLVEFPGYVYHCHILPHQDNEMMRPFMMQFSDQYLKNAALAWNGQPLSSWSGLASYLNTANNCQG